MVVIPGPAPFFMGSPKSLPDRGSDERQHRERIRRSFCIASKETSIGQFQTFLRESPDLQREYRRSAGATVDDPQTRVNWYTAAAYCNWLSHKEGITREEWCYLGNTDGQYAAGMRLAPNHLDLRGYRMPTEVEWEYACRAGSTAPWSFGNAESLTGQYAVCQAVSGGGALPVGSRKPNDFGLFDMHGNAAEWCQDHYRPYRSSDGAPGSMRQDPPDAIDDRDTRVVRGGSFADTVSNVRSAARAHRHPSLRSATIGFRVCRTYP
jgi:formylglycine-generating enzyme required for sulfatase activity